METRTRKPSWGFMPLEDSGWMPAQTPSNSRGFSVERGHNLRP
jgi:hypothetical protein